MTQNPFFAPHYWKSNEIDRDSVSLFNSYHDLERPDEIEIPQCDHITPRITSTKIYSFQELAEHKSNCCTNLDLTCSYKECGPQKFHTIQ